MARKVSVTKGAEEQAKSNSGVFKPLPAGKTINVSIFEAEETKIGKGLNEGVTGARMQFKVSEGQAGANRRLFQSVYDVERWAPKEPGKEGAVNFLFYQFYKALGVSFPEDGEVELPEIDELVGEELAVKLKIVPDTYRYDKAVAEWKAAGEKPEDKPSKGDFLTNEIKEFLPFDDDVAEAGDDVAADDEDEFDLG